jgi:uncharacterized integral membrane protein
MRFKYAFVVVVAAGVIVFALQNSAPTSIRFLLWTLGAVSLASVILLSVACGIVLVGVPLWVERWRLRARLRGLETRLAAAESRLAAAEPARESRAEGGTPP